MRSMRILLASLLLVALAACGGGPASNGTESTGGEPSTAASASEPAASEPVATPDDGGPGTTDIETLNSELEPPNSHQIQRTETPQGLLVAYESTDTVGDLKAFYVQKIAELGLTVITTTDAANTYAVAFGDDSGGGVGGTIAIQNAGDVSNVVVTLAQGG